MSLIQELVRVGVPAMQWTPHRSSGSGHKEVDKVARAHYASVVLEGGVVWYPHWGSTGKVLRWPEEVIDQCAAFPKSDHDDIVDTCTIAMTWLRRLWYAERETDIEDEERDEEERKPAYG
jgi:predicted phage terminase large subunit-like protein